MERTQIVLGEMTPLLLVLWREKHPEGKEQVCLPLDVDGYENLSQLAFGL